MARSLDIERTTNTMKTRTNTYAAGSHFNYPSHLAGLFLRSIDTFNGMNYLQYHLIIIDVIVRNKIDKLNFIHFKKWLRAWDFNHANA